jgi:hypothetical protein
MRSVGKFLLSATITRIGSSLGTSHLLWSSAPSTGQAYRVQLHGTFSVSDRGRILQRRKALMSHQPNGSSTPAGKAVLVTGCSSGIGHATAIHLARRGFTVFATVRKDADAQSLRSLNEPNLVPICPLDLAKPEQIAPVIEAVSRELQSRAFEGLYAIVNNAGGGSVAPIELMDLDKFRIEIEARILGPIALLQGFLSLIRQAHGRVVWIVTPAIIPIPYCIEHPHL